MKKLRSLITFLTFIFAISAAFASQQNTVESLHLGVIRYEEQPGGGCTMIVRECTYFGQEFCAIWTGILRTYSSCQAPYENYFIFKN